MSAKSIRSAYNVLLKRGRLVDNPSQAALVDRLAGLQEALASSGNAYDGGGLYIYGGVGTGKTRLVDMFASTMPSNVSKRRIHFHEFMMDVHSRLHQIRTTGTSRSRDPLVSIGEEVRRDARVLCFDEFQVTDIADAMILKRLFETIWNAGGIMVATSNRNPDDLYEKGLNRGLFLPFVEELKARCEIWQMKEGEDYRMRSEGKEQERLPVFFTDRESFDAELYRVTKGNSLKPVTISVMMNRKLDVEAYTPEHQDRLIVNTTFKDLCEGNLGSSDYHALCKAAGTVFISGLRQFQGDELDFIRRFITLIDIAYEFKTRVVCLSAVSLFKLFEKVVSKTRKSMLQQKKPVVEGLSVRKEGGSSSSMMSTYYGDVEWSATGLKTASMASGGAGESDVSFAIGRAVSRLFEMGAKSYGLHD